MSDPTLPRRPDTDPTYPLVVLVCAYWASLRKPHALPARAEIDPAALADALPHVLLGEFIAPRIARLRLCGHRLDEVMGMDLRGMPLSVLFAASARDEIAAALEQVGRGVRVKLALQGEPGFGQPRLQAQLALMPLTGPDGRITHVLGVLEQHGQIGRRPRRFVTAGANPVQMDLPPVLRVIAGGKA